ncbi:hypothetical protein A3D73_02840 [Candidatus Uhrbacteria bacterium RIFCSPHIGHO2_02_FULL_60_44]|nr:MAG: hypothetical protein A3D73_02840 [Candidatus Uhrbacteria bacterium RIFCSPHIGHO2_02_FULL_60_44]
MPASSGVERTSPNGPMPKPAMPPKDKPMRAEGMKPMIWVPVVLAILMVIGFTVLYFRIDVVQSQMKTLGDKTYTELEGVSGKLDGLAQANQTRDAQMAELKTAHDNLLLEIQKLEAQLAPTPTTATGTTP